MIDFTGHGLTEAVHCLEKDGYTVSLVELRSKKGIENATDTRVIRQRLLCKNKVQLCFSYVKCTATEEPYEQL